MDLDAVEMYLGGGIQRLGEVEGAGETGGVNGSGGDSLRLRSLCHPSGGVSTRGLELRRNVWPRDVDSGSSAYRDISGHGKGWAQLRREEGQGKPGRSPLPGHGEEAESEVTQRSSWREQREENQECDAGRAKRSEYFRRRVWPTVSNAAESRMGVMTALLRGCSGDSVTGSNESKPPRPVLGT